MFNVSVAAVVLLRDRDNCGVGTADMCEMHVKMMTELPSKCIGNNDTAFSDRYEPVGQSKLPERDE